MKGDTLLDYAEFQLSQSRTRCELVVSADGLKEKLASGFLKPFLTHLRAAEEQFVRGSQSIKLEPRLSLADRNARTWFTKGTIERFVRFVSTPEIVERVRTIEDELTQLQTVRKIQASNLAKTQDRLLCIDGAVSTTEAKATISMCQDRNMVPIKSRRYPFDIGDDGAEASKRELLKAMDVRLLALEEEQSMAFAQAAATGFNGDNLADLVAFAKHFGADRLCEACLQFISLLKKRTLDTLDSEERCSAIGDVSSSGSDMSLASGTGADLSGEYEVTSNNKARKPYEIWIDSQDGGWESEAVENCANQYAELRSQEREHVIGTRSWSSMDARKKMVQPKILKEDCLHPVTMTVSNGEPLYNDYSDVQIPRETGQDELHSTKFQGFLPKSKLTSDGASAKGNPAFTNGQQHSEAFLKDGRLSSQLQQMAQKLETKRTEALGDIRRLGCVSSNNEVNAKMSDDFDKKFTSHDSVHSPSGSNNLPSRVPLGNYTSLFAEKDAQPYYDANNKYPQRSSSPKMSISSIQGGHIEHSGARHLGSAVVQGIDSCSSQESSRISKGSVSSSSISIDFESNDIQSTNAPQMGSATEPSRRLSVQDAISLFESKKRDSIEAPVKKLLRQESAGASVESGNTSVPKKSVLRRWSGANEQSTESNIQQEKHIVTETEGFKSKTQPDVLPSHRENIQISTSLEFVGMSKVTAEGQGNQQEGLKGSSDLNSSHCTTKCWQQFQQGLTFDSQASSEASNRQLPVKLQQSVEGDSVTVAEPEWRKQFKVELAKSLTRDVQDSELITVSVPSRSEEGFAEAKKKLAKSLSRDVQHSELKTIAIPSRSEEGSAEDKKKHIQQNCTEILQKSQAEMGHSVTKVDTTVKQKKKVSLSDETSKHHSHAMQDGSVVVSSKPIAQEILNIGCQVSSHSKSEESIHKEECTAGFKGTNTKGNESFSVVDHGNFPVKAEENIGRESLGSSWNSPLEFNMETLVSIADHQQSFQHSFDDDKSLESRKGRFYEQYSKLRDAKLREEHASKKAEREAKLKAMGETLERRKAEMDAKPARSSRKTSSMVPAQLRVDKFDTPRSSLILIKKKQEVEEDEGTDQEEFSMLIQDQTNTYGNNPSSPSSTPRVSKNQISTPKTHGMKKTIPTVKTFTSTPHSSNRVATSLSPKSVSKNPIGTPSGQRRPTATLNQPSVGDNPLVRSVDQRKENAKPSPSGRSSGTRVHSKSSHSGHSRTTAEASSLEANYNMTMPSATSKEVNKQLRKTCATGSESKTLSQQGQEGNVLASVAQKEETLESTIYSKVRRNAVAPIQEGKPFLRKGHGIGPGAGPGVMKLKASVAGDAAKSSDEEQSLTSTLNPEAIDSDGCKEDALGIAGPASADIIDDLEEEVGSEGDMSTSPSAMRTPKDQVIPGHDDQPDILEAYSLDDTVGDPADSNRTCQSILLPAGSTHYKQDSRTNTPAALQFFAENTADSGNSDASFAASSSFRATSLPRGIIVAPFSPAASSLSNFSALQSGAVSGHFSPPSVKALDSPLGSPTSWNSSQIQYVSEADVTRSRKTWGSYQKPVVVAQQPPREPAKGLKRLLKFGRKSRASETSTSDWVSASTTSEGDDDPEESRDLGSQSADDLLRRARMQERGFEFGSMIGLVDAYGIHDQVTAQSLRSSIPAPPANFKLREDHLSGGTLLKAPRSFFSLSSFRTKGSEGKSR